MRTDIVAIEAGEISQVMQYFTLHANEKQSYIYLYEKHPCHSNSLITSSFPSISVRQAQTSTISSSKGVLSIPITRHSLHFTSSAIQHHSGLFYQSTPDTITILEKMLTETNKVYPTGLTRENSVKKKGFIHKVSMRRSMSLYPMRKEKIIYEEEVRDFKRSQSLTESEKCLFLRSEILEALTVARYNEIEVYGFKNYSSSTNAVGGDAITPIFKIAVKAKKRTGHKDGWVEPMYITGNEEGPLHMVKAIQRRRDYQRTSVYERWYLAEGQWYREDVLCKNLKFLLKKNVHSAAM